MMRCNRKGLAGLLMVCWLGFTGAANAGPYVNLMQPCDCPPNHYSAFHVLTPFAWRWAAWCQGPCRYTFAKNKHPDIQPLYRVTRYHCPSVNPLQFSIENYPGLDGHPPVSSYQSPPASPQPPPQYPPQELPPPREEKLKPAEKLPAPRDVPDRK